MDENEARRRFSHIRDAATLKNTISAMLKKPQTDVVVTIVWLSAGNHDIYGYQLLQEANLALSKMTDEDERIPFLQRLVYLWENAANPLDPDSKAELIETFGMHGEESLGLIPIRFTWSADNGQLFCHTNDPKHYSADNHDIFDSEMLFKVEGPPDKLKLYASRVIPPDLYASARKAACGVTAFGYEPGNL